MAIERKRQIRIPPIVKMPAGYKFSKEAAEQVISLAKGILLGKKGFEVARVKKPNLMPIVSKRHPEKVANALRLLKETEEPIVKIAATVGLKKGTVWYAYNNLRKMSKTIPIRHWGTVKDPRRITGALSEKKIEQIMETKEKPISDYVNRWYWFYQSLFLKAGILPENIVDYVTDGLRWKLKTMRREVLEKATDQELMIEKYFSWNLKRLVLDKLKTARRKVKRMKKTSLEKIVSKEGEGKVVYLKQILPAAETVDPKRAIWLIEQMAKTANLTTREKAVVYGTAANLKQHQIAKIAGVSQSDINVIWFSAKLKIRLVSKNSLV